MKSTMSPSAEPVTTHSGSPRSGSLLTDELLARFAKRATTTLTVSFQKISMSFAPRAT